MDSDKSIVEFLHKRREREKVNGRQSIRVGPLVQVLSLQFISREIDHEEPLTIWGRMYVEVSRPSSSKPTVHNLYNRSLENAEVLRPSGSITLVDLDHYTSYPPLLCMPLHNTKLVVNLSTRDNPLVDTSISICCAEDTIDFEQVKVEHLSTKLGILALRYIPMQLGVYGLVEVKFCRRSDNNLPISVKGTIVAKYSHGGDGLENCTLFNGCLLVESNSRSKDLELSRRWLSLPVYSPLIIDLDLSEYGSERKIVKETVEFRAESGRRSSDGFIVDHDLLVTLAVRWYSPTPCCESMDSEDESSDEEMSLGGTSIENSDDEQRSEACLPTKRRRLLGGIQPHRSKPYPTSAVEIFSISICRQKFQAARVYGFVEVTSPACTFCGFNREANDAFELLEHCKFIPILDGCRAYDDTDLQLKIDLKEVEGRFHIKGYEHWTDYDLEYGTTRLNKQLCSVFQGENGYAVIHYSIFTEAVQVRLDVYCTPKDDVPSVIPKVSGSIIAQYNNFDYTSRYNKDNYRMVLLERNLEEAVETGASGLIELSRSIVVVPINSSLVVDVNLKIGADQVILGSRKIEIGKEKVELESADYCIGIHVKWTEVDVKWTEVDV